MATTNLHIYPSTFTNESRILKETKTLARAGLFDRIDIIAMGGGNLPEREQLDADRQLWRVRLLTTSLKVGLAAKVLRHLEWMLRILWSRLGRHVSCVNCHSLTVLPLGVLFKLFWHATLIFDAHELETESVATRGIRRPLAKFLERCLIRFCDEIIVVSESIAEWYRDAYGLRRVYTVRNKPELPEFDCDPVGANLLRETFRLEREDRLFLYQGVIAAGRAIEMLLGAFERCDRRNHIVFMGYGPLEMLVRENAARCANIHFHHAVAPQELARYTACADVGVCLIEDCCLSYRYCLPNKLFEYLAVGVPVIISNLPEMVRLVEHHQCGWSIEPNSESLVEIVGSIETEEIVRKAEAAQNARGQFVWENEEPMLIEAHTHHRLQAKKVIPTHRAPCAQTLQDDSIVQRRRTFL